MDGLSAAASGIAVVSLALQLVGSVRDIRRFLHGMSEAPVEFKRLMDLLEQLEVVLEQVGLLAQRQRGNTRLGGTSMMTSVLRAITTCQKKLALLEGVVKATKDVSANSNRATRTLGSFKLVCKKTDIRWIEQQLNEAVNLLSLTMMANLTHVHEEGVGQLYSQMCTTHHTTETILQELVLLRGELSCNSGETFQETNININCADEQDMPSKTRHSISREQSITIRQYTGLFGKLLIRTMVDSAKSLDSKMHSTLEACSTATTSWTIMPSFLSRCFEYQYMNSYGCIQGALRIYPVIPDDHPVWRMCKYGDLKGMQTLLGTRQLSPFSVDADGWTLLHRATNSYNPELSEFLFELGLSGQEVTVGGFPPWLGVLPPVEGLYTPFSTRLRDLYSFFTSRCDHLDENLFFGSLFVDPHLKLTLEEFKSIIHDLLSKDTVDAFDISPLCAAMRMLHKSEPDDRNGWEETIHHFLGLGPNLHVNRMLEGGTILDQIMDIAQSPFESQEVCEEWLLVLESFGLDIEEYLQTEHLYQYEGSLPILVPHMVNFRNTDDNRYRYTIFSKHSPRVSWDWATDSEGHAAEVVHEFRNLGPMDHEPFRDYQYPEMMFNWPYCYSKWQNLRRAFNHYINTEEVRSSCRISIAIFEKRFERRWVKRAKKLQRARGIRKGPKVPGAWIE